MLGVVVIVWLPLVAAGHARHGAVRPGPLRRRLAVPPPHRRAPGAQPAVAFRTHGTLPPDPRRPYVVVANHESFVDILLISHLPWEMKWLAKSDFFKFPGVGWLMRMAGDIPSRARRRRQRGRGHGRVRRPPRQAGVGDDLPRGHPVGQRPARPVQGRGVPPGHRHRQLPILPLAVHGTRPALRKHDWRLGVSDADVYVLDPIETSGLTRQDVPALRERVRDVDRRQARRGERPARSPRLTRCGVGRAASRWRPPRRNRPLASAGR